MAEPINFNKARKAKAKADAVQRANANRVLYGRSKLDKQSDAAARQTEDRRLDGKRLAENEEEE